MSATPPPPPPPPPPGSKASYSVVGSNGAATHDPEAWLQKFNQSCKAGRGATYKPRSEIIDQGRECLKRGSYPFQGKLIPFTDLMENAKNGSVSRRVKEVTSNDMITKTPFSITVCSMDCIEAGIHFGINKGLKTVVLNMGASMSPGCGPQGAQEENLHRRSNLRTATLGRGELYPIPEDGCFFHPDVLFFRGSEARGYPFLKAPIPINIVTTAAVKLRKLEPWDPSVHAHATELKIKSVLQTCAEFNCETVVLSALGCGAFHNPPQAVSQIFLDVLSESQFAATSFKHVVFAILEDHNSKGINGKSFAATFDVPLTTNTLDY